MPLIASDLFLVNDGPTSEAVTANELFSGTYDDYWALVQKLFDKGLSTERWESRKCKVVDLLGLDPTDKLMLVNRGSDSRKVTLAEVQGLEAQGQVLYLSNNPLAARSYNWVVPAGVRSVSICTIGGGGAGGAGYWNAGGGGGGGIRWANNVPVTPGETLTVRVGGGGEGENANANTDATTNAKSGFDSWVARGATRLCEAGGGQGGFRDNGQQSKAGGAGGSTGPAGDAGYRGGQGGNSGENPNGQGADADFGGGGGAPGSYTETGKRGGSARPNSDTAVCIPSSGSGGAAGGAGDRFDINVGGGGIGIFGRGSSATSVGQAGSGGTNQSNGDGGYFGGGGGSQGLDSRWPRAGHGGQGAIRIIWPGDERSYPNTRTADEFSLPE